MQNSETFIWENYTIQIRRKKFRRSLTMRLSKPGQIDLIANTSVPYPFMLKFLEEKKEWIEKISRQIQIEEKKKTPFHFRDGDHLHFFGEKLVFRIKMTPQKKRFFAMEPGELSLFLPLTQFREREKILADEQPKLQLSLKKYLKDIAVTEILGLASATARERGFSPREFRFKELRSRWGSCSSAKIINLNWKLIAYPIEVIEYVIIHELCHLTHMNHSAKFWSLVEQHCPEYPAHVEFLKKNLYISDYISCL